MARTQSLQTLRKKINQLRAKAEQLEHAEKPGIKQLRAVILKYKLGPDDAKGVFASKNYRGASKLRGRTVQPKYRNPQQKSETWTGRGRMPRWMVALVQHGKKPEDFLISRR